MLLLLKAVIPDARSGDLFAAPVTVPGYTRGGAYVAPYAAVRHRRSATQHRVTVGGHPVAFPDPAHAALFSVGHRLDRDEPVLDSEVGALWSHFRGFVEHDPKAGRPFNRREHVLDLARDYAGEVHDLAPTKRGRAIDGGSVVDPDLAGDYWRRASGQRAP